MAGKLALLIVATLAGSGLSQDRPPVDPLAKSVVPATPAPQVPRNEGPRGPSPEGGPMRRPGMALFSGPEGEKFRQFFQNMSPEDRQRLFQRLKEFSELPPERKKEIFERGEFFRKKMREDVETALKESGLSLSDEEKKHFAERYFEERKKIEEELRQQMEAIRKPRLEALVEKLREEFRGASSAPAK